MSQLETSLIVQVADDYAGSYNEEERNAILKDLEGAEIVFHDYSYEDYNGSALTIYRKDGKFYHVEGGHCSCYGLEGQWTPEEMPLEALLQFARSTYHFGYDSSDDERVALIKELESYK